jgi:rhodanese-related sulfurtransferase
MQSIVSRRRILAAAAGGGALAVGAVLFFLAVPPVYEPWLLNPADPSVSLEDVERAVIRRYPLPDITPASLARKMNAGAVLLFDVRTEEEYAAGRLPGAIRVEPGTQADDFLLAHGGSLEGRAVVFYCAVGVRSSELMTRLANQIAPHAPNGVYNLRGGTFRWTADGRELIASGAPGRPHPYDGNWGKLLARIQERP